MSEELERKVLLGLVNLIGANRELYGAYSAVGNEPARMQAELETEEVVKGLEEWIDRVLGDEECEPILLEKIEGKLPVTVNQYFTDTKPEGPSTPARRGEVVTDLSTLRKGDVVDCYWDDLEFEVVDPVIGAVLEIDPQEHGVHAGSYYWNHDEYPGHEIRLVEKAKESSVVGSVNVRVVPSDPTDLLSEIESQPTAKGSKILAYKVNIYDEYQYVPEGVSLVHDGTDNYQWSDNEGVEGRSFSETLIDASEIVEFEILHDASKENA